MVVTIVCGVEDEDSWDTLRRMLPICGVTDGVEDCVVSMLTSSLRPVDCALDKTGGGVRIRSSKLFQKAGPAEILAA